jgi:hypothetical protein
MPVPMPMPMPMPMPISVCLNPPPAATISRMPAIGGRQLTGTSRRIRSWPPDPRA